MGNDRHDPDAAARRPAERPGRPRPPEPEAQEETPAEAFEEEGAGLAAKE